MFAPQQYPGLQGPIYGQYLPSPFIQPQMIPVLPNFQPDNREKRNLSPTTTVSPTINCNNEEKRRRNESGDIDDKVGDNAMYKEPTMTNLKTYMDAIMARLNTTATKIDVASINDRLTAQSVEFEQLRTRLQKQEGNIEKIQSQIDEGLAASLARKQGTAGTSTRMTTTNMVDTGAERAQKLNTTRRNLIVEGLIGENDDEMITHLIKICDSINVTLYKSEVEAVNRYRRRDETPKSLDLFW